MGTDLREFLARSTDQGFEDTTLSKVLSALPPMRPDGPWLAGGSLRRTLLRQEPESDFDFFFRDAEQLDEFRKGVEAVGLIKVRETAHHVHYRGRLDGSIERLTPSPSPNTDAPHPPAAPDSRPGSRPQTSPCRLFSLRTSWRSPARAARSASRHGARCRHMSAPWFSASPSLLRRLSASVWTP